MAGFVMGQASGTRVLRASEFIVSDAAGKRRASLGLIGNQPALNLYGSDGTVQVAGRETDQKEAELFEQAWERPWLSVRTGPNILNEASM